MKNIIKFILFIIYTVGIFFVENYIALAIILLINIFLMLITKINIKNALSNVLKLLPFILFTVAINIAFADVKYSILIGIRLILVCNISYIFSKNITYTEFGETIEKLVFPLKIFKIDPKDIGIIITIALSFIPILRNELQQIKNSLKAKGMKMTNINIIKNANVMFKPFFISVLKRINEVEISLRAKGYEG